MRTAVRPPSTRPIAERKGRTAAGWPGEVLVRRGDARAASVGLEDLALLIVVTAHAGAGKCGEARDAAVVRRSDIDPGRSHAIVVDGVSVLVAVGGVHEVVRQTGAVDRCRDNALDGSCRDTWVSFHPSYQ